MSKITRKIHKITKYEFQSFYIIYLSLKFIRHNQADKIFYKTIK